MAHEGAGNSLSQIYPVFPDQLLVFETRARCPWGLPLAAGCTVVRPEQLLGILGLLGMVSIGAARVTGILRLTGILPGQFDRCSAS